MLIPTPDVVKESPSAVKRVPSANAVGLGRAADFGFAPWSVGRRLLTTEVLPVARILSSEAVY
jgi:hypothetical protein